MSNREAVHRFLRRLRPNVKFVEVAHSSEFIDPEAELGAGFYYANIYDEDINANLNETKLGDVLVENSYIASFAYNFFLCWLFFHHGIVDASKRDRLILYNLKKLCSEQLYRADNSVRARTLFLESFLYEQEEMQWVFDKKSEYPKLFELAEQAANIMLFVLNQHEFAHYVFRSKPETAEGFLQSKKTVLPDVFEIFESVIDSNFQREVSCDLFALFTCLHQYEPRCGVGTTLRIIAFSFAAYASIYAVAATARKTAEKWKSEGADAVDFRSIEKRDMPSFDLEIDWNLEFVRRTNVIHRACEQLAAAERFELFGSDGDFGLSPDILDEFLNPLQWVTHCRDLKARELANLTAQAFHEGDAGFEYLYLRSKTFRTDRPDPLVV